MTIEAPRPPQNDPYAPPPVYKNKSGPMLRVVILAAVLGVAGAGYALYSDEIQEEKNTPMVQEEQDFAANELPPPADSLTPAAQPSAEPAPTPEPAPQAAPQPPIEEPLPPPTTTGADPLPAAEPG